MKIFCLLETWWFRYAAKNKSAATQPPSWAWKVKSVLRLFDELVKCDEEGLLKNVRDAVEGK